MASAASNSPPPPPPPPPKALPPLPPSDMPQELPASHYAPRRDSYKNSSVVGYTFSMMQDAQRKSDSPVSTEEGRMSYFAHPVPTASSPAGVPEVISTPPPSMSRGGRSSSGQVRRRPLDESSPNAYQYGRGTAMDTVDLSHRSKIPSINPPSMHENDVPVENHQPLQYHHHHQFAEDAQMKALSNRASKMTVATTGSEGSSNSEPLRVDHLVPGARNSYRPDSRGRSTESPSLKPHDHVRATSTSRQSRSPDNRMSYVDLLNIPYPQAPPSGPENLVNAGLRTVIGNNASLLSTMKTLEMYKANVKKTNDPAIQYEFAVFMIGAAQDADLEIEAAKSGSVQSPGGTRNDLLKEAKQILQKLCDRSYPFAQYYLADGYASGLFNNGRPDLDRSFPLFLAASKHGHAEAMYRTALCYEWGWGCRVDAAKAVQFYQHAASKNHPGAMLRLGRACLTGDMGLGKRYREGVRWLKRGAESADFQYNQAPYDLACLHETGFGADVFKDASYAAQLFTKAADLGHKDASFRLGEAYEFGQLNCPTDPALSIHFYTGAAEQGHPQAQMALCAWYMVGVENVLEKDETEAYEWARRAAEQGLPKAQYTLGYFTEMGIGCRRDPLEANVWYVQAADQGEERAKHRIAAIRAAATGADPTAAAKKGKAATVASSTAPDVEKKKRFGIF